MTRYFFQADYGNGCTAFDDVGEDFETLEQARAHAAIVSGELSRNMAASVTVTVIDDGGRLLASISAAADDAEDRREQEWRGGERRGKDRLQ